MLNFKAQLNRQKFEKEKTVYQKALDEAGYHHKLREHMVEETQGPAKRKRCRKVLWFNPPFSANIKTNIGKMFFGILMKHFPEGSELAKIFNKNLLLHAQHEVHHLRAQQEDPQRRESSLSSQEGLQLQRRCPNLPTGGKVPDQVTVVQG